MNSSAPSSTSNGERCPTCQSEMLSQGDKSYCPVCLIKQGMAPSTFAGFPDLHSWQPPSVDALAEKFPQLTIETLIGKGGMGAVYRVQQKELGRIAALKILPECVSENAGFRERFLREARLLASLSHPHIVTVYEFGQRDNVYFLLMEFVDGITLRQASLAETTQQLAPKEALAIVEQLCDALQFAHNEGVVHRDIKPENILLDKRGRVKIADFGLARLLGKPTDLPTLTRTNQLLGTPIYMAPEQLEGRDGVDHRADLYSLGVVFYELLTGELPLGRFQAPSQKADLDVRLDEVVFRTLEKEPSRRYQQASEIRTDMNAIKPRPVESTASSPRVSTAVASMLGILVGVLVCLLAINAPTWLDQWNHESTVVDVIETDRTNSPVFLDASPVYQVPESGSGVAMFAPHIVPEGGSGTGFLPTPEFDRVLIAPNPQRSASPAPPARDFNQREPGPGEMHGARIVPLANEQPDTSQQREALPFVESMAPFPDDARSAFPPEISEEDLKTTMPGILFGGVSSFDSDSALQWKATTVTDWDPQKGGAAEEVLVPYLSSAFCTKHKIPVAQQRRLNQVLNEIHQHYALLEQRHTYRTSKADGALDVSIHVPQDAVDELHSQLWQRLDDIAAVNVQQALRDRVILENSWTPAATHNNTGTWHRGLLGWRFRDDGTTNIHISFTREGRWYRWTMYRFDDNHQAKPISGSAATPTLPPILNDYYSEPTPALSVENARNALANENDLLRFEKQFTPTGQFDWTLATWLSLKQKLEPNRDVNPELKFWKQAVGGSTNGGAAIQQFPTWWLPAVPQDGTQLSPFEVIRTLAQTVDKVDRRKLLETTFSEAARRRISCRMAYHAHLCKIPGHKDSPAACFTDPGTFEVKSTGAEKATGVFHLSSGTDIPLEFRFDDHQWKIHHILAPGCSMLTSEPFKTVAIASEDFAPGADSEDLHTTSVLSQGSDGIYNVVGEVIVESQPKHYWDFRLAADVASDAVQDDLQLSNKILRHDVKAGDVLALSNLESSLAATVRSAQQAFRELDWKQLNDSFTDAGKTEWTYSFLTSLDAESPIGSDTSPLEGDFKEQTLKSLHKFADQFEDDVEEFDRLFRERQPVDFFEAWPEMEHTKTEDFFVPFLIERDPQTLDRQLKEISTRLGWEYTSYMLALYAAVLHDAKIPESMTSVSFFHNTGKFTPDQINQDSGTGVFHTEAGEKIPIQFRREGGRWKINRILTPFSAFQTMKKLVRLYHIKQDIPANTQLQPEMFTTKLCWQDNMPDNAVICIDKQWKDRQLPADWQKFTAGRDVWGSQNPNVLKQHTFLTTNDVVPQSPPPNQQKDEADEPKFIDALPAK